MACLKQVSREGSAKCMRPVSRAVPISLSYSPWRRRGAIVNMPLACKAILDNQIHWHTYRWLWHLHKPIRFRAFSAEATGKPKNTVHQESHVCTRV
jgi:hypothetical protein